jgi:hypothetical protein
MLEWTLTVWLIYGQTPPETFHFPTESACIAYQHHWADQAQAWLTRTETQLSTPLHLRVTLVSHCQPAFMGGL